MKQESVTVSWLNPHIEFKAIFGLAEWTMMRVMMKKLSRRDSSQDGRYLIWYLIVQQRLPPTCSVHWTMSTTTATGGSFLRNTCVCNDTWLSIASPLDNLHHCKLPLQHMCAQCGPRGCIMKQQYDGTYTLESLTRDMCNSYLSVVCAQYVQYFILVCVRFVPCQMYLC